MFYLGNLELKLGLMGGFVIRGGVFGFFYYMGFLLCFLLISLFNFILGQWNQRLLGFLLGFSDGLGFFYFCTVFFIWFFSKDLRVGLSCLVYAEVEAVVLESFRAIKLNWR